MTNLRFSVSSGCIQPHGNVLVMGGTHTIPTLRAPEENALLRPPETGRSTTMATHQLAVWGSAIMLAAVVLAGCSEAGPQEDSNDETSTADTGSSTGGKATEAQGYSWGLPASDTSVAGNDGPAYAALQLSCTDGQAYLDSVAPDGYGFRSPLNVVLFAAGVKLCNGEVAAAGELYAYGIQRYGLSGLPEGKPECELYKSVRSVLEQQPRTAFPCPGGLPPENIVGVTGLVDDPLTMDVDESEPTDTPASTEALDTPTPATDTSTGKSTAATAEPTQPLPETSGPATPTP